MSYKFRSSLIKSKVRCSCTSIISNFSSSSLFTSLSDIAERFKIFLNKSTLLSFSDDTLESSVNKKYKKYENFETFNLFLLHLLVLKFLHVHPKIFFVYPTFFLRRKKKSISNKCYLFSFIN